MTRVVRGDTTIWDIPIVDTSGEPYPLNGCSVWVTVKASEGDVDEDALYQHFIEIDADGEVVSSSGLSLGVGGAAAGVLVEELTPAESAAFIPGRYSYDVQVLLSDGRIYTPIRGENETVHPDWTNSVTIP
jgi:hypothetical protein